MYQNKRVHSKAMQDEAKDPDDLQDSIRQFLKQRLAKSHLLKVQRQRYEMYKSACFSSQKTKRRSNHTSFDTRNFTKLKSKQAVNEKKSEHLVKGAMLQTLYADKISLEQKSHKKCKKWKLSNDIRTNSRYQKNFGVCLLQKRRICLKQSIEYQKELHELLNLNKTFAQKSLQNPKKKEFLSNPKANYQSLQ